MQAVAQVSGLSELLTLERPVLIMPGAKGASPAVDGSYKEPWFDWLQAFSTGYQVTHGPSLTVLQRVHAFHPLLHDISEIGKHHCRTTQQQDSRC